MGALACQSKDTARKKEAGAGVARRNAWVCSPQCGRSRPTHLPSPPFSACGWPSAGARRAAPGSQRSRRLGGLPRLCCQPDPHGLGRGRGHGAAGTAGGRRRTVWHGEQAGCPAPLYARVSAAQGGAGGWQWPDQLLPPPPAVQPDAQQTASAIPAVPYFPWLDLTSEPESRNPHIAACCLELLPAASNCPHLHPYHRTVTCQRSETSFRLTTPPPPALVVTLSAPLQPPLGGFLGPTYQPKAAAAAATPGSKPLVFTAAINGPLGA